MLIGKEAVDSQFGVYSTNLALNKVELNNFPLYAIKVFF